MTSLWRKIQQWGNAHQRAADFLLMAFILALVSWSIWPPARDTEGFRQMDALGAFLAVTGASTVAFRRRNPAAALSVCATSTFIYWILDYQDSGVGLPLLIVTYSAAAYLATGATARKLGFGFGAIMVAVLVAGLLWPGESLSIVDAVASIVFYGTAWVVGDNVRTRRDHLAEVEKRAEAAEAQRESEAARAIEQERTAIARELHDVVAHGLSVMVVQTAAARRILASNPTKADEALQAVEETGRSSIDEMRRLLGVLRSDRKLDTQFAPLPGLNDLETLVDQVEGAGLNVRVQIDGDARALPVGIELSAYRIVQESLTNALKHAGPAKALVRLSFAADELKVEVSDDGRGGAARSADAGGGQGLLGMRERVESTGGEFAAGPQVGGGYRVSALLPISS